MTQTYGGKPNACHRSVTGSVVFVVGDSRHYAVDHFEGNDYGFDFRDIECGDQRACQVAQRPVESITGSYKYGQVDRFKAKAGGTSPSGSISQATTTLLGSSGLASHLASVTTGSGGDVSWLYRIESRDSRHFVRQSASVAVRVYHNVGSAVGYTITVNKANAEDNFLAVTQVATSGSLAVATDTDQLLTFSVTNLGDVSNGIEIVITGNCGAQTSKDCYLTGLQVETGMLPTPFAFRPFAQEFLNCLRNYERIEPDGV